jgi:hypothetical protein
MLQFTQRKKLKIATAATVVRQCKHEAQRSQLRAEEQYHFNRITSGYLAEAVVEQFKKFTDIKVEEKIEEKIEEKPITKKNVDDVFLDDHEEDFGYVQAEPDFFEDLLKGSAPELNHAPEEQAPAIHIEPVSTYMAEVYNSRKELIDSEPRLVVNRKGSLRKINECVRKRLRYKEEEEETVGRSLASATVFLSNLLNSTE